MLTLYLFTPVTHPFFSPLSPPALPCGFLSHTGSVMVLQWRENDLGDHLKPIMAALQPPRNSVTDGDLVFIAGVIGNTQKHSCARAHTHTYTHTHHEEIQRNTLKCTHVSHSCVYTQGQTSHTHGHICIGLTGSRKGACSLSACCAFSDAACVSIKQLCHGMTNKAHVWPERHVWVVS